MSIDREHAPILPAPERAPRHLELVPPLDDTVANPEATGEYEYTAETLDVTLRANALAAAFEFMRYDPHKTLIRTVRTTTDVTEGWCIPGQTPSLTATYLSTTGMLAGVPKGSYEATWLALPTLGDEDLLALHDHLEQERKARRFIAEYRTN